MQWTSSQTIFTNKTYTEINGYFPTENECEGTCFWINSQLYGYTDVYYGVVVSRYFLDDWGVAWNMLCENSF